MAAIDYLREHGLSARVRGERIIISPRSSVTEPIRQFIKLHRLELLAELAANDGETRRAAWDVSIPGYGKRRMIGEPCTHAEALEHVRGIWPGAAIE
ncbi:hypothetical protein SAMN05216229_101264 [Geopseudomonas sagittaria]|uniref:TubC N-terminal docking domain-containing protein n=1 Tax=Geopseudomonas sagittaria TaxID=1135990 RepID=A0A1I5P165_9GAMM|nr:hypothetical protein [Pseudomonas sagittaria]MCM2329827.1 hypothetical protein [Pseudomonas sagittaria]SFP27600.1 hypothetical protein SAMN05216229_101264 [Pseudomonas sagittaria]